MKVLYLPLYRKFIIVIIITISVFALLNVVFVWKKVFEKMDNEISKRIVNIGKNLAEQSVSHILTKDIAFLQRMTKNTVKSDSTIIYAFITDNNNNILAHSFQGGFPENLLNFNIDKADDVVSQHIITENYNTKKIRDFSIPILNGELGTIRLGTNEDYLWMNFRSNVYDFIFLFTGFTLIAIIGAFAVSWFITKPIKIIKKVTEDINIEKIEQHNLITMSKQIKESNNYSKFIYVKDEIDDLSEKFSLMLIRLDNIYKELISTQNAMNQSEKLASIGTLIAGIAHEVNNPLSGLKSCIRRMNDKPDNIEQNIKYLSIMNEATEKIQNVMHGLLDFTRTSKSTKKPYNISLLLENTINLIKYGNSQNSVEITGNYKDRDVYAYCNKNEMEQVFFNLLKNSIDAIEEKLKLDDNHKGSITVNIDNIDNWIIIEFQDNGIGISKENLHKVADPFYTTKDVGKGTGLGCSICYNIIREHNGEMKYDSEYGKWTSVKLILENNEKIKNE